MQTHHAMPGSTDIADGCRGYIAQGASPLVLRLASSYRHRCRAHRHRLVHLRTMRLSACAVAKCDKTWRMRTGTL
ncbi:hypothetical protein XarjCFBP7653_00270 [Xanthomonas arboricola]|nr:hypothetical protein XarjCFBP7653_00270 [Xanthomonas arboricola]